MKIVKRKGHDPDTLLVYEFMDLARGTQQAKADLVNVDRSLISLWKKAKEAGEEIGLNDDTRERMQEVVARLKRVDPHAAAHRMGMQEAVDAIQVTLDGLRTRLESLAGPDGAGKRTVRRVHANRHVPRGRGEGKEGTA